MEQTPGSPGTPTTPQPVPAVLPANDMQDIDQNKDLAALGYLWVLSIFIYYAKGHSPFVRFHSRQGIAIFLLSILCWLIPIPIISRLFLLILLAFTVMGFLAAAQGQRKELPIVYPLATGDWKGLRRSWKSLVDGVVTAMHSAKAAWKSDDKPGSTSTQPPSAPHS